jgi:hypothetical protein
MPVAKSGSAAGNGVASEIVREPKSRLASAKSGYESLPGLYIRNAKDPKFVGFVAPVAENAEVIESGELPVKPTSILKL